MNTIHKITYSLVLLNAYVHMSVYSMSIFDATKKGDIGSVHTHIAAGADVTQQDISGWTPLHYAARDGHKNIALALITAATKQQQVKHVDPTDYCGSTPLYYAVKFGHPDVVLALLNEGANPEFKNSRNETPVNIATVYIAMLIKDFQQRKNQTIQ